MIALTVLIFVSKVMSLLFSMLPRFAIAFLPRSKRLLIPWLQSPSAVILEPKKIESAFILLLLLLPIYLPWNDGTRCLIFIFWMFSFKPAFSLSSFTFFLSFFLFFFFNLFYFAILYWFCHTLTWIHHRCIQTPNPESHSHLSPHIISLDHPHATAPSILYPVSNIDWHFVSYMIVYMLQCHSPKSSHTLPLPQSPKVLSIHLCLFCCLPYRVIITIFLNSIYMCQYTVLVFFFLAYFTLYNWLQFHPSH